MKQTSKLAFYLERMASRSIPARQVLRGTGLTVELLDDVGGAEEEVGEEGLQGDAAQDGAPVDAAAIGGEGVADGEDGEDAEEALGLVHAGAKIAEAGSGQVERELPGGGAEAAGGEEAGAVGVVEGDQGPDLADAAGNGPFASAGDEP